MAKKFLKKTRKRTRKTGGVRQVDPNNNTAYDIFQIPINASDEDIKKAYKKLSRKYHPDSFDRRDDVSDATADTQIINDINQILTKYRQRYDDSREKEFVVTHDEKEYNEEHKEYTSVVFKLGPVLTEHEKRKRVERKRKADAEIERDRNKRQYTTKQFSKRLMVSD